MEICLNLQYQIAPETTWCRTEVAEKLGAVISDTPYISTPQFDFVIKRECKDADAMLDEVVEEIRKLIPEASLQWVFRIRPGGRLPVVMYDPTGRGTFHFSR